MKKLVCLLALLPAMAFSQTDLKQSAEDFVKGYFKLFEEKKWDIIPEMYAEDAQVIWLNGEIQSMAERMKPVLEKCKTEMPNDKIDVKWILSDVTGPESALVTTSYTETMNHSGNVRVTDNMGVMLLERKEGSWKIKKWIPTQNFPLLYHESIDQKYRWNNTAAVFKAGSAIDHTWSLMISDIAYAKDAGISAAEFGQRMGVRYAKSWNPSAGFEGLANNFTWGLQIMSKYVEVLERNETTLKAKFLAPVINDNAEVTKEDLYHFSQNVWSEIAGVMGGSCTLAEEGTYWILTMNKK